MPTRFQTALISKEPGTNYGVVFPDLPDCISAGITVQEAAEQAAEALALHIEVMCDTGEQVPPPSAPNAPLPNWMAEASAGPVVRGLIPTEMPGRAVPVNVTLDEGLLSRLDAAAAARGMSRSGFIAQAVRECLQRLVEA